MPRKATYLAVAASMILLGKFIAVEYQRAIRMNFGFSAGMLDASYFIFVGIAFANALQSVVLSGACLLHCVFGNQDLFKGRCW